MYATTIDGLAGPPGPSPRGLALTAAPKAVLGFSPTSALQSGRRVERYLGQPRDLPMCP